MRLTFSTGDYRNTNVSDEQGRVQYTISTPSSLFTNTTTITKYNWNGESSVPETMGVIKWSIWLSEATIQFNGKTVAAETMLQSRAWNTGRFFRGPDGRTYKWKLQPQCWMKLADTQEQLVRYHRENLGILKPSHPAYLDVSAKVVHMLDHIIITFVYMEHFRQVRKKRREQAANSSMMAAGAGPSC